MPDFLNDAEFDKYRQLIYAESGIHFSETNRSILESRLKERLREKSLGSLDQYYGTLVADKDELKSFLDSITTNLTRFFRNQAHFDALEHYVFPYLIKAPRAAADKKIRIWSAGCSTGEEPFTIAMLAKEKLPPGWKAEVVASDISLKSLMVGKEAYYPDARIAGIPEEYLAKYFDKVQGGYRIHDEIKDSVSFDYHNLKNDSGHRNMDIVFCRNVIIYFDEAAQKATIERFWDSLAPDSFLFIGHSESLFGMKTRFEFVKTDWACFYRKGV